MKAINAGPARTLRVRGSQAGRGGTFASSRARAGAADRVLRAYPSSAASSARAGPSLTDFTAGRCGSRLSRWLEDAAGERSLPWTRGAVECSRGSRRAVLTTSIRTPGLSAAGGVRRTSATTGGRANGWMAGGLRRVDAAAPEARASTDPGGLRERRAADPLSELLAPRPHPDEAAAGVELRYLQLFHVKHVDRGRQR